MDCYICNINTDEENHCSVCREELYPLQVFLSEFIGNDFFKDSNAPFIYINDKDHIKYIECFLAGAQLNYNVVHYESYFRLTSSKFPPLNFTYTSMKEAP